MITYPQETTTILPYNLTLFWLLCTASQNAHDADAAQQAYIDGNHCWPHSIHSAHFLFFLVSNTFTLKTGFKSNTSYAVFEQDNSDSKFKLKVIYEELLNNIMKESDVWGWTDSNNKLGSVSTVCPWLEKKNGSNSYTVFITSNIEEWKIIITLRVVMFQFLFCVKMKERSEGTHERGSISGLADILCDSQRW